MAIARWLANPWAARALPSVPWLRRTSMDALVDRDRIPPVLSIAKARELLGEECAGRSDDEVKLILSHAQAMAQELIDIYLKKNRRQHSQ